jgi:queuine tRNA-ribosyltransferase
MATAFQFDLLHTDQHTGARRAQLQTPRGTVELPTFMPVGTVGTVKGLDIGRLRETGAQIILGNTYHLALRPGDEIVAVHGGLHRFMGWTGPILTDSGGFQVFSLAKMAKITEQGVTFRSHIDGSLVEISPERSIEIQENLGSDFVMQFDHVVELPNTTDVIADAMRRSIRWAERCLKASLDFPGFAIGGLSVGEPPEEMYRTIEATIPALPIDRPRYLMGVGRPEDLVECIARGIDMFDCVMPTRNGRNALAFTDRGPVRLRNASHERDQAPLEANCPCPACQHSRGYLRHLFQAREMLGPILASIHNLTYYQRLMAEARSAIEADCFAEFRERKMAGWRSAR